MKNSGSDTIPIVDKMTKKEALIIWPCKQEMCMHLWVSVR